MPLRCDVSVSVVNHPYGLVFCEMMVHDAFYCVINVVVNFTLVDHLQNVGSKVAINLLVNHLIIAHYLMVILMENFRCAVLFPVSFCSVLTIQPN